MDTIFQTGTIRCDMHLFLNVSFSLEFQIGCSGFSETETHNLLFVLYCLPNHVGFVAVLPVCALLIKFPIVKFIVFIKQKREHYMQNYFDLINVFMSLCQVFILAGPPQTHHVERSFVSMLELSCPLLVLFVFSWHLIIIQLSEPQWCGWLLPSMFGFPFHQLHSSSLPDCSHFLLLVCGFRCMFSIWKKTPLGLWGKF